MLSIPFYMKWIFDEYRQHLTCNSRIDFIIYTIMTNSNINRAKKLIQGRQHNGQYIPCFKRVWYSFEQINPETNQTCKSLILLINRENAKSTINEILSRINSFISMPFFRVRVIYFFFFIIRIVKTIMDAKIYICVYGLSMAYFVCMAVLWRGFDLWCSFRL